MILSHYNDADQWRFDVRGYVQSLSSKPNGLWLSVDGPDDWPCWCHAEGFRLGAMAYRHVFELKPERADRVLHITDTLGVDMLTERLSKANAYGSRYDLDWPVLARKWSGIIIAPYQWRRRLDGGAQWYYGWDCASGCIWDVSAIRYVGSEPFDVVAHVARLEAEATHAV